MFGRKQKSKEKVKLTKESYQKAKNFFVFMKPYRFVYFIGWIFLILSSLTAMLFPMLMGQLLGVNNTMPDKDFSVFGFDVYNINHILILMIIVFGFQSIFSFFRIVLFSNVTEKSLKDFKEKAFSKMLYFPMDFYNKNKVGELTSRIATDINLVQTTLNTTIAEFFRQIITIIVAIVAIFYFSWELALWMLAIVPVVAIFAVIFGRYVRKLSKQAQNESAASNSILEEVLSGIINVKAFTNEKHEFNRYQNKILSIAKLNIKNGIVRGVFVSFIIFCLFGAIAFVIWKAKEMEGAGLIENTQFNQFILYTIFLGASFGALPDLYAGIQKAIGSTEHLMGILEEKTENNNDGLNELTEFSGKVSFKDVHFAYPSRSELSVLNGISFECEAGETIALVGSSGAGKTTISSLLLKFYEVEKGEILFNNQNINTIQNESLRKQIAIVPQDVILFGGTIKENIAYGNLNASEQEIEEAAKKANAWEFIEKFPEKLETYVGDRGIQLSGGQKQRIAIARAVLKNPKILILDEATSALDTESEKLVQDALEKLMENRTSFVIAHRLSTIKKADRILVLENGKIVESGKHDDLIANELGTYYKLNNMQV